MGGVVGGGQAEQIRVVWCVFLRGERGAKGGGAGRADSCRVQCGVVYEEEEGDSGRGSE